MNNYYCFSCETNFRSSQDPDIEFTNEYGLWTGIDCPICGGQAKKVGEVMRFNVNVGFTDKSRAADLEALSDYAGKGLNNASRILNEVHAKAKDENLANMRKELVAAHRVSDVPKAEVIESRIKSYEKKHYGK